MIVSVWLPDNSRLDIRGYFIKEYSDSGGSISFDVYNEKGNVVSGYRFCSGGWTRIELRDIPSTEQIREVMKKKASGIVA